MLKTLAPNVEDLKRGLEMVVVEEERVGVAGCIWDILSRWTAGAGICLMWALEIVDLLSLIIRLCIRYMYSRWRRDWFFTYL